MLNAGTKLGPYEIQSPLGAGGMGEVYRARDTRLDRTVAIKILPAVFSSDADRLQRFEHEARVLSSLNHPNLLAIHDVGAQDGVHYLVSEFLEGQTLREKMNTSPLSQRRVLKNERQGSSNYGSGRYRTHVGGEHVFQANRGGVVWYRSPRFV